MNDMIAKTDILTQVTLFADLSEADLTDIGHWFRAEEHEADDYIFFEGDQAIRMWIVGSGQVKIFKHGSGGKEIVIEVISPGEIFGGVPMLMTNHPATAQALSHVTTLSISIDDYRQLLWQYPQVGIRVIEMLGDRLLGVIRMRMMISERVERRLAHILLKMADKCGTPHQDGIKINLSLTRQDIADLADTTIETTIRTMSTFRKEGLVRTLRGGYVIIRDPHKLRQISQRDPLMPER